MQSTYTFLTLFYSLFDFFFTSFFFCCFLSILLHPTKTLCRKRLCLIELCASSYRLSRDSFDIIILQLYLLCVVYRLSRDSVDIIILQLYLLCAVYSLSRDNVDIIILPISPTSRHLASRQHLV